MIVSRRCGRYHAILSGSRNPFCKYSWGIDTAKHDFPSLDEIYEKLDRFVDNYPGIARAESLGVSADDHDVRAVHVTDADVDDADKEVAMVVCGRHGNSGLSQPYPGGGFFHLDTSAGRYCCRVALVPMPSLSAQNVLDVV